MIRDECEQGKCYYWRSKIDARHQGKGFGKHVVGFLIKEVKKKPGVKSVYGLVIDETGGPFHLSCGFATTG